LATLLLQLKDRDVTAKTPKMTHKKIRKIARMNRDKPEYDLLLKMIQNKALDRPTIGDVIRHPYFAIVRNT